MQYGKEIIVLAQRYLSHAFFCPDKEKFVVRADSIERDRRKTNKAIGELVELGIASIASTAGSGKITEVYVEKTVVKYGEMLETQDLEQKYDPKRNNDWNPEWNSLSLDEQLYEIWKTRGLSFGKSYWATDHTIAIFRDGNLIVPIALYNKIATNPTVEYYFIGDVCADLSQYKYQHVAERLTLPFDKKHILSRNVFINVTTPRLTELTTQFALEERIKKLLRPCLGWGLCKFGVIAHEEDFVPFFGQLLSCNALDVNYMQVSFDKMREKIDRMHDVAHKIDTWMSMFGGWDKFMEKYKAMLTEAAKDADFCAKYGV